MFVSLRCLLALALGGVVGTAQAAAPGPEILPTAATRFSALYAAAGGKPSVAQLEQYLAQGTPSLAQFAKLRRVTAQRLAEAMAREPAV